MAEGKPRKKRQPQAKNPEAAAPAKPVTPPAAPTPANDQTAGEVFNAASAQELLVKGVKKAKEFAEENPNAAGALAGVAGAAFISTALPVLAAGALLGTEKGQELARDGLATAREYAQAGVERAVTEIGNRAKKAAQDKATEAKDAAIDSVKRGLTSAVTKFGGLFGPGKNGPSGP